MLIEKNTETQIISNASEMFLTKGFKSVTMDDLASNMGMSKKTIYSYFKTKNDLVSKVSIYISDIISTGINFICAQNRNPIEEIYVINDFVRENLKKENSSPIYQLQKYYPEIHSKLVQKQFEVTHGCLIRNIENGIEEGLYRNNLNIDFIARLYFSSAVGIKNQDMFPKSKFPANEIMISYLEYHIHGIATEKGLTILKQIKQKRKL